MSLRKLLKICNSYQEENSLSGWDITSTTETAEIQIWEPSEMNTLPTQREINMRKDGEQLNLTN